MKRLIAAIAFGLACLSCAAPRRIASAEATIMDPPIGEFTGAAGAIRIDVARLRLSIGNAIHPIVDCSTGEFYCFKNEELGFHVAFPRSCATRARIAGETVGGFTFYQFAGIEHGDVRQGRYASEMSDRFSYGYFNDRGLEEIQYDPTGLVRFGPRQANTAVSWRAYTYRLAAGRAFLRCRP
jgi:hypothetical protein